MAAVLEDCPSRHRGLPTAAGAVKQAFRSSPRLAMPTTRALKSFRPAQSDQVLAARLLGGEPRLKFLQRQGVILHGAKHYMLGSLGSTK
jgi:hypothetical protein